MNARGKVKKVSGEFVVFLSDMIADRKTGEPMVVPATIWEVLEYLVERDI